MVRFSAWMFSAWGAAVALKSVYDLGWGEPEANLYAPRPWAFVTQQQWLRYAGFELTYGLAAIGLGMYLFRYSRFVPETIRRPRQRPELDLFR